MLRNNDIDEVAALLGHLLPLGCKLDTEEFFGGCIATMEDREASERCETMRWRWKTLGVKLVRELAERANEITAL